MFTLFNSDNEPDVLQTRMNLNMPKFINITAGEPFTFHVAAYGTTPALNIVLTHANKGAIDSVEID
jgi:hypothetical protein